MCLSRYLIVLCVLLIPMNLQAQQIGSDSCQVLCEFKRTLAEINCLIGYNDDSNECHRAYLECGRKPVDSQFGQNANESSSCDEERKRCKDAAEDKRQRCIDLAEYDYIHCSALCPAQN